LGQILKWRLIFIALLLLLFLIIMACLTIGPAPGSILNVFLILAKKILGLTFFKPEERWSATFETIVFAVRLPRLILAALVGAALASAGVVLQGLLKNPLADPYILGISSGAALGATLAILLGVGSSLFGSYTLPAMAFFGAIITIFIVYNISRVGQQVPMGNLLLAGIAVGAFFSALVTLVMVFSGADLHAVIFWLMGGLANRGWGHVKAILPYFLVGIIPIYLTRRKLNLLLLGEEAAQHLGVEVETLKVILLGAVTLMVAASVSVSGIIGFVGLIIPHIFRLLAGPDHRILLPLSALGGAIFLVLMDTLARTAAAPLEIPVGVITALWGGPFFIYLLRKKKSTVGF